MAKPRNKRYSYIIDNLLKLKVEPGSMIIDCACGDGYGSSVLKQYNMNVVGYDISENLVSIAIERGVEATVANICDIPCEDNTADVFICSETLEHLEKKELQQAIKEIKRITKKDGIICITVPQDSVLCLRNKNHKQYLSYEDLDNIFNDYKCLFHGVFCKKPGKCNTVIFFRQ